MAVEILGAFLTGGTFVGLINLIKWYIERKDKKKEKLIPDVLGKIHEVYHILNVILRETSSSRVILLRAENGGDVPSVGKELYSSIVYEVFDKDVGSIKNKWQKQPLDEVYIRMLLGVAEKGHKDVNTSNLPTSTFKDFLENSNIIGTQIFKIRSREGAFFYISVNFKDKEAYTMSKSDSGFRDLLRYSINKLNRLIT